MHFPIIWIERIPLLQVYFSHVIVKQGAIFEDICFKVLNFVLLVPPLVWFTMDLQTGHLEGRYHAQILLLLFTMEFFIFFSESIFPKNYWFCVLPKEN